jgi:methylated-DNA-protein-cysteine methyltransferase related protein
MHIGVFIFAQEVLELIMGFKNSVINFVKKIPKGKVASYGQAAAACGHPRAARQVGGILRGLDIWGPQISEPAWQKGNLGKGAKFQRPKRAKNLLPAEAEETIVPWWRVVNNQGVISIKGNWEASKELQRELLRKEGIEVSENFTLDINRYRYL